MTNNIITAVGIDVSKGKSMIAIRHPGGEVLRIHRTEQPKQQKLKTAATHSLFRVVQGEYPGMQANRTLRIISPSAEKTVVYQGKRMKIQLP